MCFRLEMPCVCVSLVSNLHLQSRYPTMSSLRLCYRGNKQYVQRHWLMVNLGGYYRFALRSFNTASSTVIPRRMKYRMFHLFTLNSAHSSGSVHNLPLYS